MHFCFPALAEHIDWSVVPKMLDKELMQIAPQSDRCRWKMRLLQPLYQRGLTAEDVRKLFRVLDWMMQLPEDIELKFQQQLEQYEQEHRLPYITSIERMATQKGREEGILIGEIRMLQRILSIAVESDESLTKLPHEELARKRDELQQRFDLWQSEQRRD